jgi:hypothetical protein
MVECLPSKYKAQRSNSSIIPHHLTLKNDRRKVSILNILRAFSIIKACTLKENIYKIFL